MYSFYTSLSFSGLEAIVPFVTFKPSRAAKPVSATPVDNLIQIDLLGVAFISRAMI